MWGHRQNDLPVRIQLLSIMLLVLFFSINSDANLQKSYRVPTKEPHRTQGIKFIDSPTCPELGFSCGFDVRLCIEHFPEVVHICRNKSGTTIRLTHTVVPFELKGMWWKCSLRWKHTFVLWLINAMLHIYRSENSTHSLKKTSQNLTRFFFFEGTMFVYQVTWNAQECGILHFNKLSCFKCEVECAHYFLKAHPHSKSPSHIGGAARPSGLMSVDLSCPHFNPPLVANFWSLSWSHNGQKQWT